jgi:S1-C subfamily serine protease
LVVLGVAVVSIGLVAPSGGADGASPSIDLAQRINLAVVAIEARVGDDTVHNSGTIIDADRGLVLTSNRSVWGATSLRIGTGLGLLYGRIVARAPCDDIAILETYPQIPGLLTLPLASAAPPTGELLTAIGRRRANPDLGPESLLRIPALTGALLGTKRIRLDAELMPEATGGPLVDHTGRLVGMAQAVTGPAARTKVLAASALQRRLSELRPGPREIYVGWRSQYRCSGHLNAATKAAHPAFEPRDAQLNAPVPATRLPGTGGLDAG